MSSALDDEKELEDAKKEKQKEMVERSKRREIGTDISNISGGKGYRYESDPVKG